MSGRSTDSANGRDVIIPDFTRDILESDIPRDVLDILLADRTTGKNIMWMTDGYVHLESVFDVKMGAQDEIDVDVISRPGNKIIRPRVDKSKAEQKERIQKKAEVFTPSWICNHALAEAFNYMNVIEQWGSGLRRVSEELAAYGAKPLQLEDGGIDVRVNVFRNVPAVEPSRKGAQKNTPIGIVDGTMDGTMALRIVSVLKNEPSITIDKLSERLNVARRSLVRYMNILQKSNRIKRIGGKRFGHWEVV